MPTYRQCLNVWMSEGENPPDILGQGFINPSDMPTFRQRIRSVSSREVVTFFPPDCLKFIRHCRQCRNVWMSEKKKGTSLIWLFVWMSECQKKVDNLLDLIWPTYLSDGLNVGKEKRCQPPWSHHVSECLKKGDNSYPDLTSIELLFFKTKILRWILIYLHLDH